ncbi:hypothetical protein [Cellulomonas taurus]|uniref:hypothetical protein n=1 Tax=Cellulomonas taurus TaxID=2729175 RepID=UPI00145EFA81|nr:hypothetical protein [Cellulomonas taurus]
MAGRAVQDDPAGTGPAGGATGGMPGAGGGATGPGSDGAAGGAVARASGGAAGGRGGVWSALLLLIGSGLALAGLLTLIVFWVQVATGSMLTGAGTEQPCVAAAAAGTDDAEVTYAVLPASAVCTWTPSGATESVPLAAASVAGSWAAGAAVLIGLMVVAWVGWTRWRRRRSGETAGHQGSATHRSVDG